MKTISRIQYFLFAIILIGMFASFAQNDYSSYLLNYPYLLIGISFLIGMMLTIKEFSTNKTATYFLFFEYLALGLFFCGSFLLTMHWASADPFLLLGVLILLVLYLSYGIKILSKYFNKEQGPFLILFCISIFTCLAMIACIFKLQNWSGAGVLISLSGILSFVILLLILINVRVQSENGLIPLRVYFRKIKTKLILSYIFFSFWTIYFTLTSFGIAPRLYSLANPPALEKMYQDHNPKADLYWKNFQNFLDSRKATANQMLKAPSKNRKASLKITTKNK